jgi:hypothetical protein
MIFLELKNVRRKARKAMSRYYFKAKRIDGKGWAFGLPTHTMTEGVLEIRSPLYDSDGYRGYSRYEVFEKTLCLATEMIDERGDIIFYGDVVESGIIVGNIYDYWREGDE